MFYQRTKLLPTPFGFWLREDWIVNYMVTLIKSYNSPSLALWVIIKSWWLTYKLPTLYWKLMIFGHFRGLYKTDIYLLGIAGLHEEGRCVKINIEQCVRKGTFNSSGVRGQKRLHKGNILSKGGRVLRAEGRVERSLRSEKEHWTLWRTEMWGERVECREQAGRTIHKKRGWRRGGL